MAFQRIAGNGKPRRERYSKRRQGNKMFIQKELDCGVRLIAEPLKKYHSVTVGIWVGAGSVTETREENGISHLIEHMLFKGTEKRTAKEIAVDVDNIGGQMNAFTSKECTCYYIRTIDEKLEEAIEILTDLFSNATLDAGELEKEKGVVLEEIAMTNDSPEDVAADLISETFFGACSLGKTIIGPPENIRAFSREDLKSYIGRYYTAENIVVAVAGNFEEDKLVGYLNQYLSNISRAKLEVPSFAHCGGFQPRQAFAATQKDIEQVHIWLGLPSYSIQAEQKYALNVLNNTLGGSMSSRLFQKIREEMGMAYSVYSHLALYRDTGMFGVYAGTTSKNAQIVTEMLLEELMRVKKEGITQKEFEQSKQQLKANLILSMESTSAKMNSIGKALILTGKAYTEEQMLRRFEEVTYEDVQKVIEHVVVPEQIAASYVGKVDDEEKLRSIFA